MGVGVGTSSAQGQKKLGQTQSEKGTKDVNNLKLFDPGSDLVAPRLDAADRERAVEQFLTSSNGRPIVVLIDADPAQSLHSTLVFNRPDLGGPIVRAWNIESLRNPLLTRFPDRDVYLFRPTRDGRPAAGSLLRRAERIP